MNRNDDKPLLVALRDARRAGRKCALATVVETRGSTPRKAGSKMLVDPVSGLVGTIGGGCGEAEVIEAAHEVLNTGRPRLVQVDLTRDLMSWSPAVCGGVMRVLVEPVEGDGRSRARPPTETEAGPRALGTTGDDPVGATDS